MNEDLFFNILIHSTFDDIRSLCMIKNNVCHQKSFWQTIFERDGLTIINDHCAQDWMDEYKNIVE